jgi:hypothetical protein
MIDADLNKGKDDNALLVMESVKTLNPEPQILNSSPQTFDAKSRSRPCNKQAQKLVFGRGYCGLGRVKQGGYTGVAWPSRAEPGVLHCEDEAVESKIADCIWPAKGTRCILRLDA